MIILNHKFADRWYDTLNIHLTFPKLITWIELDEWSSENRYYGVKLKTECSFVKDPRWWKMTLQFLGFGIIIMRQKGY